MIETRNGSGRVLSQQVWGLTYVDELVQTAMNQDPGDTTEGSGGRCERYFYILQDANFNVLGSADAKGALVERYEYTPYGQRTVYSHDWIITDVNDDGEVDVLDYVAVANWLPSTDCPPAPDRCDVTGDGDVDINDYTKVVNDYNQKDARVNDPLVSHPRLASAGGLDDTDRILPVGVCDFGHQGLLHDKEFGLIHNRARYLHPRLGRFTTRDPIGYADGMSLYEYVSGGPSSATDPKGLRASRLRCRYLQLQDAFDVMRQDRLLAQIKVAEKMRNDACAECREATKAYHEALARSPGEISAEYAERARQAGELILQPQDMRSLSKLTWTFLTLPGTDIPDPTIVVSHPLAVLWTVGSGTIQVAWQMGKSYNAEALGRQNVKEVLANKDFRAADVANLRGAISEVYRRRCEGALATEMGLRDGYDRAKAHRAQVRQRWHAGRCTSYFLIPWYSYLGNPTRERRERIDWSYYDVGQLARELGIEPTP